MGSADRPRPFHSRYCQHDCEPGFQARLRPLVVTTYTFRAILELSLSIISWVGRIETSMRSEGSTLSCGRSSICIIAC